MSIQRFLSGSSLIILVGTMALSAVAVAQTGDSNRQVQFANVDFVAGVIELHNFGDVDQPLDGWRFCTANQVAGQVLKYTLPAALDGRVLAPGASLFFHMNNDAPAGDPNAINRSDTGTDFNWALPFNREAYGLALYFPVNGFVNFGSGAQMVDYVQWGDANVGATSTNIRADEAVLGQFWNAADEFVFATPATTRLVLRPAPIVDGTTVDSPASYSVIEEPADCAGAGGNADADSFCDLDDPCPAFPNGFDSADADGNGIPNDCQCGDANFSGNVEADDLFDTFNCQLSDSEALRFPCAQIIFKGDSNFADSGRAAYEAADLFNVFQATGDVSRRAEMTCPARPVPGAFQIPQ
jgi:hypothetical protein